MSDPIFHEALRAFALSQLITVAIIFMLRHAWKIRRANGRLGIVGRALVATAVLGGAWAYWETFLYIYRTLSLEGVYFMLGR